MNNTIKAALDSALSYTDYRANIDQLLTEGKTTGDNHSEDFIHYTELNVTRMKRIDKTTKLTEEVQALMSAYPKEQRWLIITEVWCGDAAQVLPVIERMAEESAKVSTHYALRDQHLDLIDMYLTNGGRSIPKVLIIDVETDEVVADWGPRPSELQALNVERKESKDPMPYAEFSVLVQKWYAKDRTKSTQDEFSELLKTTL